jgi:hypothetical protein
MITSSTPGGVIPQWIADRSMPGKIQEDVPAYIEWMHKRREKVEKELRRNRVSDCFQGICFPPFPYAMSLPPGFWSELLRTTSKRDSVVNIAVIGPPECGKSTFIRKAVKNLFPQALPPIRRRGYSSETTSI